MSEIKSYCAILTGLPEEAVRFAVDTWGASWCYNEAGSLVEFVTLAQEPVPVVGVRKGGEQGASAVADRALAEGEAAFASSSLRDGDPSRGETFDTIRQWCEGTFGPATPERIATRAAEEMDELLADPRKVEEAADIVIILSRHPTLWAEVERKMAINRKRQWRLMGDGSGYHIPAQAMEAEGQAPSGLETKSDSATPSGDVPKSIQISPPEVERLVKVAKKALEHIADYGTVSGMHDQDRAPKLQYIAKAALHAMSLPPQDQQTPPDATSGGEGAVRVEVAKEVAEHAALDIVDWMMCEGLMRHRTAEDDALKIEDIIFRAFPVPCQEKGQGDA